MVVSGVVEPVETTIVGKSYDGGFDKLNHRGIPILKIDFRGRLGNVNGQKAQNPAGASLLGRGVNCNDPDAWSE